MAEVSAPSPEELVAVSSTRFTAREKSLALVGSLVAFAAFWFAGKLFHIPTYPKFSAALVQQQTLIASFLVTLVIYSGGVLIGGLIARIIGFDAGVFCASVGLCALSIRGGGMRYTLFEAAWADVWIKLAVELAILGTFVGVGTILQHALLRQGLVHSDDHRHVVTEVHRSIDQRLLALATNVIVITIILMLLAASDRKAQSLAAVTIASLVGTLIAYYIVPTRPSAWYWSAPIIVGVVGYIAQSFTNGDAWRIGEVRGALAALARPLPLDYAGAGVAASMVGYWISRRWQHEREISTVAGDATR